MKSILSIIVIFTFCLSSLEAKEKTTKTPEKYKPSLCTLPNGATGAQCAAPDPLGPCQSIQSCYAAPVINK